MSADALPPRSLAALERRVMGAAYRLAETARISHPLRVTLESRLRAAIAAEQRREDPAGWLLLLADWCDEAAGEFRALEEVDTAAGYVALGDALRLAAQGPGQ
jgi:hypothetical protein